MDEQNSPNQVSGTAFRRITRNFKTAGGARRNGPKVTVAPTGASRTNTEAKEMAMSFMKDEGHNPNDFQFAFGGNEEAGQFALYAPQPGDTGLMKATLYDHSISFHAGAVFAEYPKLRPSAKVDCHIERTKDAAGVPCLVVHVLAGTPTRTTKRKNNNASSAAGDKKA